MPSPPLPCTVDEFAVILGVQGTLEDFIAKWDVVVNSLPAEIKPPRDFALMRSTVRSSVSLPVTASGRSNLGPMLRMPPVRRYLPLKPRPSPGGFLRGQSITSAFPLLAPLLFCLLSSDAFSLLLAS